MDWGFLVGFTLGSIVLGVYHLLWVWRLCVSNSPKFAKVRNELFMLMLEFGEIVEMKEKK